MPTSKMEFDITAVDNASDAFRAVANAMDGTEKKAVNLIAEVSKFVTFGLMSAKVWQMTQAASDLGEAINLNERIFKGNSAQMREWAEGGAEAFGLSTSAALDFSAQIGGALQNLGYDMDDASVATQDLIERAADMASAFNKDVTQAIFAVQAGLRGETEPLRQFNVFLDEARIKAKALELGLYDGTGALDKYGKAMAVQALIMEDTNQIAGDFQMTSDGLANSQRILQAHLDNLKTNMGTAFLPVVERVVGVFNNAASAANDMNPIVGQAAVTFGLVGSAAAAFLPKIKALYTTMATAGGGGLVGAFKQLSKVAGATAVVMAGLEIADQTGNWETLGEAVDGYINNISRMGSSGEIEQAIVGHKGRIEELQAAIDDLEDTNGDGSNPLSWIADGIGDLIAMTSATISGRDAYKDLEKAQQDLGLSYSILKAKRAEEIQEELRLQATMGITKQSSEDLTTAVADINTAWEDGRSAADLFRQALDNLIDSQFGSLDSLAAYEGSVDDFTEALKTAAKTGMSWQEVMSMQEAEARSLQSAAKSLVGDIVNLAMEEYETAEATKGHEAAMRSASDIMETKFEQALQKLQRRFGITREEAEMLLGSFEDYNLAELIDKNPQVKPEGVEQGVDDSLDAIDRYNRVPMDDKQAVVDPSEAVNGVSVASSAARNWGELRLPTHRAGIDPSGAQSGASRASAAAQHWNNLFVRQKHLNVHTNAWQAAYDAQRAINQVRGRTVYLNVQTKLNSPDMQNLLYRAEGGPVKRGEMYVVGEEGPEFFVPDQPGQVLPNDVYENAHRTRLPAQVSVAGGDGEYAPVILQLDTDAVWRGLVRLRRRRGQSLGLS